MWKHTAKYSRRVSFWNKPLICAGLGTIFAVRARTARSTPQVTRLFSKARFCRFPCRGAVFRAPVSFSSSL
jgi:hypothetical protein